MKIKNKMKIIVMASAFLFSGSAFASDTEANLISLSKGEIKVIKEWKDVSMGGFWPVLISKKGQDDFVYTDGKYLFLGNLIKVDGTLPDAMKNVMKEARNLKTLDSRFSSHSKKWEEINALEGITEGTGGPKVLVAFDPLCHYCQKLFLDTRKAVSEGKITIKWVPINNFEGSQNKNADATSSLISSAIFEKGISELTLWETSHKLSLKLRTEKVPDKIDLSKNTQKEAIAKMKDRQEIILRNKNKQRMSQELIQKYSSKISHNTAVTRKNNVNGTPYSFYSHNGQVDVIGGYLPNYLEEVSRLKALK